MLATLLVHAGRTVPIDTLVAWIWPEDGATPLNPAATFHTYATRIRSSFRRLAKSPRLLVENGSYRLDVDKSVIDYGHFRTLLGEARAHARADAHRGAVDCAERALGLWRGRPLADLASEPAKAWRVQVLRDEWMPANVIHIDALLRLGEFGEALSRLDDLRPGHDGDVTLAKLRLSALYGLSRYAEETAHYLGMRRLLLDEADEQAAANLREHHEGLRASSTSPVTARPPREPVTVPRQLPPDIPEFVGRAELLRALDAAMGAGGRPENTGRVVVLDGMAGVGKSALAVHWGHRSRHRFPDGDFFVDLQGFSDGGGIAQSTVVDELLIALGSPPSGDQLPRAKELLLKRLMANRRALVILDNARNTDHVKNLVALLPSCSLVVTSRQRLTRLRAATGARQVHVDPMTPAEATDLFSARLGDRHPINTEDRRDMAALCGGLPLVITVLAQHVASRPAAHLAAFAEQLDRRQLLTDIGEDGDGSTTAEALFYRSYQALELPEQRLFRLLGLHPGPDISGVAARACAGQSMAEVKRSLHILVAAHLLGQQETFDRYRFHDLIREFARRRAEVDEPAAERGAAERRLLHHYLTTATQAHRILYPGNLILDDLDSDEISEPVAITDDKMAKTWFSRERANLVAAVSLAAKQGYHEYAWRLTEKVDTFLDRQGCYADSRKLSEIAVLSARVTADRAAEASALVGLGMVQLTLGDHAEARSSLDAALCLVQADGDERGQASTLYHLGRLEFVRGNPGGAIRFYQRCLDIALRTQDGEALCWTHCRMAESLRLLNQNDEALTHLYESRAHAKLTGDDSAHATSTVEIGSIHRERGDSVAARSHCEEALKMVEGMPFPDLDVQTSACVALAEIHNDQHDTETATKYILRAIEDAEKTGNTTALAGAQEVYGDIQVDAGEVVDALKAWQVAAKLYEQIGNAARVHIIDGKINKRAARRLG